GETAGIPFAALIAERLGLPMSYVRKKPKGYGRNARIEGVMTPGQRVLLVEDHPTNRTLVTHMLGKLGLTDVVWAGDGRQALARVRTGESFGIILMDVQMPGMNGLDATRAIRRWQRDSGAVPVPIIGLSANAFEDEIEEGRRAGMDDFVVKPVMLSKLREALARALAS
ncbi:MAG: response regulator, partial [Allosphingosinicella sp.]